MEYVTEEVAKNLLQMPEISLVQILDTNPNGFKHFHMRMSVNLSMSLRKCMFLRYDSATRDLGC